jgi:hypothetical protein
LILHRLAFNVSTGKRQFPLNTGPGSFNSIPLPAFERYPNQSSGSGHRQKATETPVASGLKLVESSETFKIETGIRSSGNSLRDLLS